MGAFLQSAIVFLTPGPYALLLPALLLFVKLADTVAMTVGLKHDPYMDESIMGRYSAQILDKDSNYPDKVGNEQVVVMMLGVRSNQSVTHLSPPPLLRKDQPNVSQCSWHVRPRLQGGR